MTQGIQLVYFITRQYYDCVLFQACVRHIQVLKSQCTISENSTTAFTELISSARLGTFDTQWALKSSGKSHEVTLIIFSVTIIGLNEVYGASLTR